MLYLIIAAVVIWLIFKIGSEKKTYEKEINAYKRNYEREFEKEITENNINTPLDLYMLGLKCYEGYYKDETFIKDYQKAAYMWEKAATQGLAEAQYGLGIMYETGNGVKKSNVEALNWYKKAAEQGDTEAQKRADALSQEQNAHSPEDLYNLGKKYYDEHGVEQINANAFPLLLKAANQGHADAQFLIGKMCYYGKGVKQDLKIAEEWLRLAANQGHANAKLLLDKLCIPSTNKDNMNENTSHNNAWGKNYYDKALAYEYGIGVSADKSLALSMYETAVKAGYQPAKEKLEKLRNERIFEEAAPEENISISNKTTAIQQQGNVTNNTVNNNPRSHYIKAQNSKLLFDQAVELKRKGQYAAALTLYKSAYESYPDDPDVQSTMYAMAKIYLLTGDYEKACTLFQDGLTMKLAQTDERTGRFYQKNVMSEFSGGLSESDPDYQWFHKLTADYSIFIGLSHYLLENDGYELLSRYRYDFNNHMQSVAGKSAPQPSADYLRTCYDYGWSRVIAIASESYNRCFDKIDFGHVQKRKQEFLDILETI